MTRPVTVYSTGPDHTRDLASALGELSRPGDLLVLVGELGAGKTAFAQGLGAGLGVTEQITSPTFALVQSYPGRILMHHLDVYRLEQVNEALDLGLAEMLDEEAVMVIEWGDAIAPVLPHDYLEVRLRYAAVSPAADPDVEMRREIQLLPVGPRWSARMTGISRIVRDLGDGGGR